MQFVTDHLGMTVESIRPRGGSPQPNGMIFYDVKNGFDDPGERSLQFEEYSVTEKHVEFARANFNFSGMGYDPDTDEPLHIRTRVGVLDTERVAKLRGWSEERRKQVEEALLNNPDHGLYYKLFVPEKLSPPWPTYDEMRSRGGAGNTTAKAIVEFALSGGFDLGRVLEYERETKNRADVVAALSEAIDSTASDLITVSA